MTVEDIKLTVLDYALDRCTEHQIVLLQRYFIREYCAWMPLRAIAEQTGAADHSTILDSIRAVRYNPKLWGIATSLALIFNLKIAGKDRAPRVKWYPNQSRWRV